MGRRTYEVSLRTGAFPYDCLNVVMARRKIENKWGDKIIFTSLKPKEILCMLENKGFDKVIVTGGHLSASFMKEKLVDEIWVDLMPRVFTNGIRLFDGEYFDANLKFIKSWGRTIEGKWCILEFSVSAKIAKFISDFVIPHLQLI